MKKIMLFASAALLFAGCAKENVIPTDGNDNPKGELTLSFTASQAGFGTKAVIGDTTTDEQGHKSTAINWQSTDKISVFDGANENCEFSAKDYSEETPTSCTFEGDVTKLATDYTAVYPYTSTASIDETGVISGITLPATQTAVEGSFDTNAALMVAKTVDGGRDLAFQNLVGYVKVATDFDCTKIELCAGNGEALAGVGNISFDAESGKPSFALAAEGAATAITLTAGEGGTIAAGKTYYIAVPATTLAVGWSISFTASDGNVYKREAAKPIVFKKNTVINLGTINLDDLIPYVTFSAESEQTFTMNFNGFTLGEEEFFDYRVGKGEWTRFNATVSNIAFGGSLGDLQLRGISNNGTASNLGEYTVISFSTEAKVSCSGDIRTLVDYKNYETANTSNARFCYLFSHRSQLTSAPDLPATSLATLCYYQMFYNCGSLRAAPALPATNLAESCYAYMFGYSGLETAPELNAMEMQPYCYEGMFDNCWYLQHVQDELPATTLAEGCYQKMFNDCSSLTSAPALPATELKPHCYESMFSYSGLETAPALEASELAESCYRNMFSGSFLTTAPELPAMVLALSCYQEMFRGCASLTTAPKSLPARHLPESCYQEMFCGCRFTSAPKLPPLDHLESRCCAGMFKECFSLSDVWIQVNEQVFVIDYTCFENWLYYAGSSSSNTNTIHCNQKFYDEFSSIIPSQWAQWNFDTSYNEMF